MAIAGVVGHKPTDFPSLYNAQGLPAASTTTLAVISDGNLTRTLADLKQFTTGTRRSTSTAWPILAASTA